jgi:transposase InsO family protein
VWNGGPLAQALRAHPDDPGAAVAALRAAGITHLAVGEATLARWERAGWLDPVLTPERIRAVTSRLKPVARTTSGGTICEIPAP